MSRSGSMTSNVAPLPNTSDPSIANFNDPTPLLISRLENWSHAVSLMEDFVDSNAATQKNITANLEKSRKAIADAPRFDQETTPASNGNPSLNAPVSPTEGAPTTAPGEETGPLGISDCFATMRTRTEHLINLSTETESALRNTVSPQLKNLQGDIDKHLKSLRNSTLKTGKEAEKAIQVTAKAIENLNVNTTHFSTFGGTHTHESDIKKDPYVTHRYVLSCLDDQITKENQQIDTIIFTERNFQTLERHIVQVLQQASGLMDQILSKYSNEKVATYAAIASNFSRIPEDYEWNSFVTRRASSLVDPNHPNKRDLATVNFTGKDHASTVPIMAGILQRKEGLAMLKSYTSGFYVVTHSGFLHHYNSQDSIRDPLPVFSLYLPDTQLGPMSTRESGKYKFTITGKDKSKTISLKKSNFVFKTTTYDELAHWYDAISQASGGPSTATHPAATAAFSDTDEEATSPVQSNFPPSGQAPVNQGHNMEQAMASHSINDTATRPF